LVAVGIQGVEEETNGVTTVLALLGMGCNVMDPQRRVE
jgi:hypothetical protein